MKKQLFRITLGLIGIMGILSLGVVNAQETCGPGYVENAAGTGCELIQVTFDANGGSFSNEETIKIVEPSAIEEISPIRYSHTANINDEGVASSVYANNLSTNDVITIPGATGLSIEVRFVTEGASYDWLAIYPNGITPSASNYNSATISNGKLAGHGSYTSYTKPSDTNTTYHRNFTVTGDTAQFYFKSDSSSAYYGYYAIINGIGMNTSYECEYDIQNPVREGYVFQGWYKDTGYTQRFDNSECLSVNTTLYAKWYQPQSKDIILEATATSAGQTLKINKYFANVYKVDRGDGTVGNLASDTTHIYSEKGTYAIVLSLSGADRWTFRTNYYYPLVPKNGTAMTGVKITYMPSLADGFGLNATAPGNYFFGYFNYNGALISLPDNSFDTSNIETVGDTFFYSFNRDGQLTSLPEGSFRLSTGLTKVGNSFFFSFNNNGQLTSLPEGSFDISNIETVGDTFFSSFNSNGQLTSLPENSFRLSTGLKTVGNSFFGSFNSSGALISLPEGSFDTSNISTVGSSFFGYFNKDGQLTSLPGGSFDTSNIMIAGRFFFGYFNSNGQLTSLPTGSFDISNITTVGDYFFSSFNYNGKLTSLPDDSFDTSHIITGGNNFFYEFNRYGQLTSLPTGSFRFSSGLTTVGDEFFSWFNQSGAITTLPEKSFDLSHITAVGGNFFYRFNDQGQLESLPEGSFDTSNITTAGNSFFSYFNAGGQLKSLPIGSFRLSTGLTTATSSFFCSFNRGGQLTSLPEGSFDTSNITTTNGDYVFSFFNDNGQLTSLPEGSFRFSTGLTRVGPYFFYNFNYNGSLISLPEGSFRFSTGLTNLTYGFFESFNEGGKLVSLPEGSFDTSNITEVGTSFFENFNHSGALTSLPEGSFDISNITSGGNSFFYGFNWGGALTTLPTGSFILSTGMTKAEMHFFRHFNENGALRSLPEGSFDTSHITSMSSYYCFYNFNYNGALTSLPESFKMSSLGASNYSAWMRAFSSSYTINRKVSDLVAGLDVPTQDKNVFSDNQPGRCGVHEYWLVSKANACSISYDNGVGVTGKFKYNADSPGVVVGSGIIVPTREGYVFSGRNDASGNNIEEVIFPEMDGQTLYANWIANEYTIVFVDGSGTETDVIYTGAYESTVTTDYPEWTKEGYTIHWDKEIPDTMPLSGETITASWTINQYTITLDVDGSITTITGDYGSPVSKPTNPTKNGYTFKGWEPEIPDTMPAEDMTIKAKWEKNGSSGGGGGGGGGSSSQSNTGSTGGQTGNNTEVQTGSQINSNIGDIASSGANEKEPENGTGNNAENQTGSQVDSQPAEQDSEKTPQNDSNTQDSSTNASEGQNYSQEFQQAYEFAKGHGITTMPTIQKAEMNSPLTRIAMAKMLSQYAMNVLGQKPANIVTPKFNDVTDKQNSDYDNGVTLAYQLGIMGQNMPNNRFRPNDEVTRAEFATALSRMIYGTSDGEYKGTGKYYIHHMEKLVEEGIITKDDPTMKELRGYVMIMLMRSAK